MKFRALAAIPLIVCSAGLVLLAAPSSVAHASLTGGPVLALRPGNVLISFDATSPTSITHSSTISGLVGDETIVAMDIRPATGQLYAVGLDGGTGHVYTINSSNGMATLVNDQRIGAVLPSGGKWSLDFNPVADRMRLVHTSGVSYRINPLNGSLVGIDTTVDPAKPSAIAYDRSTSTAPAATTLFAIDATSSTLNLIGGVDGNPSPNAGLTASRGPLGVNVDSPSVGFDIAPAGDAYATLGVGGSFGFYSIDLPTGTATLIGNVGGGVTPVLDIALPHPPVGPLLALTDNDRLLRFDAATPGTITSNVAITGLASGENVVALDVRPATGEVMAVGVKAKTGRLYRLDIATGALTPISDQPFATDLPFGGSWSADFNPVVDRFRLIHSSGDSYRINPSTGQLAGVDVAVTGIHPRAVSYDRSSAAASLTTLFAIDDSTSTLNMIGGPDGTPSANSGAGTPIGSLGVSLGNNDIGFDVTPIGVALATLRVGGFTGLYTVDLGSGEASAVGTIGDGSAHVTDLAALPDLPDGASQFTAVSPARLLDTRLGAGKPGRDTTLDLQVAGLGGVPASATAVVLNVTGTEATTDGFLTVYPTGVPRPVASSSNLAQDGTKAALTTTKVGTGGKVSIYVQNGAHIVVDVFGYYAPSTSTAGRFIPLSPGRLIDTRDAGQIKPGSGGSVAVQVLGQRGVPVSGVSAVIVNLTVTDATAPGFVRAYASGTVPPDTSNLNVERVGGTISNLAVVPVGDDGKIVVFTQSGAHIVVDVAGWYTDDSWRGGYKGLFVPVTPSRVLDTRRALGATEGPLTALESIDVLVAGQGGVPEIGASGVIMNLTAVNADGPGYVTLYPTGTTLSLVSSLNVDARNEIVPNLVASPLGPLGKVTIFDQAGGDLVLDVAGWFTG